jgi:hypothetical protein
MGINRLRAAMRLDAEIPVVMNDHTGEFSGWRELRSLDEMYSVFTDKPIIINRTPDGMTYTYGVNRSSAGEPGPMPDKPPFTIHYVKDAPVDELVWKLVRNPAYGGTPSGHPKGYPCIPYQTYEEMSPRKPEFHDALEKDIIENGVRNPVILQQLPIGLCAQFGGSRIRVSHHAGLPTIPAIVVDYTEKWKGRPVVNESNWQTFFTDIPKNFEFNDEGCDYHYALERRRRHEYDSAGFDWLDGKEPEWLKSEFGWLYEED